MDPSALRFNDDGPRACALRLNSLKVSVQLGCSAIERATRQDVRISLKLKFATMPQGALTDTLTDTVCYAELSEILRTHCESREFNLIERMGFECYSLVRSYLKDPSIAIHLDIHKVRPPVEHLLGGTHFECGDFL